MRILIVAGARPNFVKVAPLIKELKKYECFKNKLVHTGQHYDAAMSDSFFQDLQIPVPDYNLNVGSGSHAVQTANIMIAFEEVCIKENPNLVVVVGDVNSTIACALVAKKLHIKVAHVEAGLRSFDSTMPEEINRKLTDVISDYLFVSEQSGLENLTKEGVSKEKIFHVGNIMIDSLMHSIAKISSVRKASKEKYGVITFHRPSNVDSKERLVEIINILNEISKSRKLYWPTHPRTMTRLNNFELLQNISKNIKLLDALGYIDFLSLIKQSEFVITDSGGVQEETSFLDIPCLTLRENTERPITISNGTNTLVNLSTIMHFYSKILDKKYKHKKRIVLWDGKAAEKIRDILLYEVENGRL